MRRFAPRRKKYIGKEDFSKHGLTLEILQELHKELKDSNNPSYHFFEGFLLELKNGKDFKEIVKYYQDIISIMSSAVFKKERSKLSDDNWLFFNSEHSIV